MNVISVDNLTFCYNGLEVISNISFAVKKGDYLGIAGPNGSGKSTLIKNILGILRPQKGAVDIFGQPLTSFHQWNRIGYLPQRIIAHLAARLIGELSYGEQQRTMLARTLISQPDLLIFDEPTTALDPETRDIFYSLTDDMNRTNGTTIVLITHDTGVIGKYACNLLYLDKKIIFSGTFEDFCASPDMTGFFGPISQHMICHQHDNSGSNI
jgi:zinc transport system ATP-binding protein